MGRLENRGGGNERKGPPGPPQAALLAHRVDTAGSEALGCPFSRRSPAAGGFPREECSEPFRSSPLPLGLA